MPNELIVVTGPGRSGTSLFAHLLSAAGASLSAELLPASPQNPGGLFEDAAIVALQKRLMEAVYYRGIVPKLGDWTKDAEVRRLYRQLRTLVERNISDAAPSRWLVKDPRISILVPQWRRIFAVRKLTPLYFFCSRNPCAVRQSMSAQYSKAREEAELIWLVRTVRFLRDVRCRAFIVHYEDWFTGPRRQFADAVKFAGLQASEGKARKILSGIVRPDLDRSAAGTDFALPDSERLYAALRKARGTDFDRNELSLVVQDVLARLSGYSAYRRLEREVAARRASAARTRKAP